MNAACVVALISLFLPAELGAARPCRYDGAHYRMPGGRFGIAFIKIAQPWGQVSDLAMRVRDEAAGRDVVYYYFDEGSAPRIGLISTTNVSLPGWHANPDGGPRPRGTATFIALDTSGHVEQSAPSSASRAARLLIIPEFGEVLKNSGISFRRNDAFVLSSCSSR